MGGPERSFAGQVGVSYFSESEPEARSVVVARS